MTRSPSSSSSGPELARGTAHAKERSRADVRAQELGMASEADLSPLEKGASERAKITSLRKLLDFTASVRDTIGRFIKNTGYCV